MAAASGGPIVLDLRGLTFMDSSGIHACLDAAAVLQQPGWCLFLHANDGPLRLVLEISAMDRVPNIHVTYDGPSGMALRKGTARSRACSLPDVPWSPAASDSP
jgi:anti-anti-sigma regulatory factor